MRALLIALLLASPAVAQDADRGARLYAESCAVCHGLDLRGDGPMATLLVTPPPDLTLIAARNGGDFPRIGTAWRIDGRDPILSHGADMPLFGYILGPTSVVMSSPGGQTLITSREIVDLVAYLEAQQAD